MAVIVPSLRYERPHWRDGATRIVGVDEVGVAPTCGAVVAAAVIMKPGCHRIPGVRDSKTLSAQQRERLTPLIRRRAVAVGVGAASVAEIERVNVRNAEILALRRALARVGPCDHVLLDGKPHRNIDFGPYTAIVDGDASSYSIACASILAKVVRDRIMRGESEHHPGYDFDLNKGYPCPRHKVALAAYGPTAIHRRSWVFMDNLPWTGCKRVIPIGGQLELL